MRYLDRSDMQCQPCDNFVALEQSGYGPQPHACFSPFGGIEEDVCGMHVYFCANCYSDHHEGGYNSCRFPRGCAFGHPLCMARQQAATIERGGEGENASSGDR